MSLRLGGLAVDGLSAVLLVTLAVALAAVLAFAAGERYRVRFYGLMLLFAAAMAVTVTATDLVMLLMGWEVMGAMSYALIGYVWSDAERVRSADVAFLTTRAADMGLYAAAGFALAGAHSLRLDALADADTPWRDLIAAGIVLSALGKSAQLPFSFWLARAMSGPSTVSALLHSATMVAAGAYLLTRVHPLLAATGWADALVAWTGAVTALVMGAVALAQRDLKQLLAASTCAQIGLMVLGAGAGSVAGGTAQLVAHAAVKSLLFLCAGAWVSVLGTQRLDELRGAARRHRVAGAAFGAGALALAGVPPLSLWVTKDEVLAGRPAALLAVGLAASVLSAAYAAKALFAVFRPAEGAAVRVPLVGQVPLVVLAFAAAGLGVLGLPPVAEAWREMLGAPREGGPAVWLTVLSGALAVVTVGAVRIARRVPSPAWAAEWLYLERAADAAVVRPAFAVARALARFDDRVVDGAVRGVARGGRWAAGLTGRRIEIRVDGLVGGVGRAAQRLAALARSPQTGQVHIYFAQAAVVLAVLAVIAVLAG
ncbi:proton-conducting transporter membrane subunit [Actinomadura bangladeshensis]|uniref:NADH-quinone oxidoreductase subunit L n=1 Tax=Actinomadura bangladeshensis TaxID=453573 RepID=A0A4R4PDQ1_9ACTN|nr:proton-conducting transporter membrane subunit [Actinomadura bangladeshensis]TDC19470.1 NADH-quinone oxidoreductase subunit L [Actinomadura bangladeshensis]